MVHQGSKLEGGAGEKLKSTAGEYPDGAKTARETLLEHYLGREVVHKYTQL